MSAPDLGLANWLLQRARRTPARRALTFEGTTWTYAELQHRIDVLAGQLRATGVARGDRVAYLGLNQPAFLVAMFATARIGGTFVPLNFRLTGPELAFIVNDAGAGVLIADSMHQPVIDGVRGDLPVTTYLSADTTGADGWASLDPRAEPVSEGVAVDPEDVAVIMYTSGTTGRPKGAMLTHANIWWNNTNELLNIDVLQDDVTLTVAPLFHIGGLNVLTLITWMKGGEVLLHRAFDPGAALEAIDHHGVTTMFGVPAMFQFMAQHPSFETSDLTSLRTVVCGGAPCPEPLLKIYEGRGVPIQQGYGLTETSPMVTFLGPEHALAKIGSSGVTPLFCEVKLIDGTGSPVVEPFGRGEVCVRGPNVTLGYWGRPEATAEAIGADGWFRTGDVAYFDEDGFIFICDRVKDMIITGGENVYPAEVESVLFDHPAVAEVAVVGIPDERWGEAVVAVVALAPGAALTLDELRSFAGERLARFKLPSRLETVPLLPRNAAGKILKYELRDHLG
jgi:fatty-acyl-CoA synthase